MAEYVDKEGIAAVAGHVNTRLKVVSAMPLPSTSPDVVLYVGASTGDYKQGGIYLSDGSAWALISQADVEIDSALSTASTNPVQNKVVTQALAEKLPIVDTLPSDNTDYEAVILSTDGHNYTWDDENGEWVDRTPTPVIPEPDLSEYSKNLITDKKDSITDEQIETYDTFDTYDEAGEGTMVFGEVAEGDNNPVDGDTVYTALHPTATFTDMSDTNIEAGLLSVVSSIPSSSSTILTASGGGQTRTFIISKVSSSYFSVLEISYYGAGLRYWSYANGTWTIETVTKS